MHSNYRTDESVPGWPWSKLVRSAVEMSAAGLRFAGGPVLVPMDANDTLALETGWDHVLCLLSVAYRKPVPADMLRSIEAAAGHWQRGDKVLANLRLVFAGLPRPDDPSAPSRVTLAAHLLGKGLSPRILMSELGLDPSVLDLVKFNPAQPLCPQGMDGRAGSGEMVLKLKERQNAAVRGEAMFLIQPYARWQFRRTALLSQMASKSIRSRGLIRSTQPASMIRLPLRKSSKAW